ncbi:nucleotidyltransferase substrate binding protein [Solidesulfovibrio sp.]|uniref:nucleotidyltransferase substrate binding protein n=1 Tax=Solidesulfovibrio sp. TaxID=2910990 RepID=UPI00261A62B2|nr:nucleotidyltransferase substrate binding protein [Solidesulfovibrio sp.]
MPLDLTSLAKAVEALGRAVDAAARLDPSGDAALAETVRAGVIQQFEVAYELCWKFLQRWLRENATPEEADFPRTRKELFRLAARHGLIADPLPWFGYGEARNRTSHTYDGGTAQDVSEAASDFLPEARALLEGLKRRND